MLPEGFTPQKEGLLEGVPELGIGMLGYEFMGKAHSNAYRTIPYMFWPPVVRPRLIAICGRTEEKVSEAATRYGYEGYYTDYERMLQDPRIQVFDNVTPDPMHCEPSIAAAEAGKHVLCEKPMGMNSEETGRMLAAVRKAGVKNMCSFNYRFMPAVRLAKDIIDRGMLGEIKHFRGSYLFGMSVRPGPGVAQRRGGGNALLPIGSHVIDMARFLAGDIAAVNAMMPGGTTVAMVEFASGAYGTIEANTSCPGKKNNHGFEIHGTLGSLSWDLTDLNRLQVFLVEEDPASIVGGYRNVLVTEAVHNYIRWEQIAAREGSFLVSRAPGQVWWPQGHIEGWEHGHINAIFHFLDAIANDRPVAPYGATFEDGHRVAVISDAIIQSAAEKREIVVPA